MNNKLKIILGLILMIPGVVVFLALIFFAVFHIITEYTETVIFVGILLLSIIGLELFRSGMGYE